MVCGTGFLGWRDELHEPPREFLKRKGCKQGEALSPALQSDACTDKAVYDNAAIALLVIDLARNLIQNC
jgi:hypothetical protein